MPFLLGFLLVFWNGEKAKGGLTTRCCGFAANRYY
jgi:hypothetical protein